MSEQEAIDTLRADQSRRLEQEAIGLVKQYGFFLPAPAKDLLRKVADFNEWQTLRGQLK